LDEHGLTHYFVAYDTLRLLFLVDAVAYVVTSLMIVFSCILTSFFSISFAAYAFPSN